MHIVVVLDFVFSVNGHCDGQLWFFLLFLLKQKEVNNVNLRNTIPHYLIISLKHKYNISLTCSCHCDTLRLFTRLTVSCWVVRSDTEAVLAQRLKAWADVVGCVFTLAREFGPAPRSARALLSDLHNVTQNSCASIVAGTHPRQDQGLSGQLGNNRLGCWWIRSVWWDIQQQNQTTNAGFKVWPRNIEHLP